jgi:hypothetical protein
LLAPVLARDDTRNPVAALRRSWLLTRGNTARLLAFIMLATLLFAVVFLPLMMILGVVLSLGVGGSLARLVAALVSSAATSGAMVYFAAMMAAVHAQLASPANTPVAATFD